MPIHIQPENEGVFTRKAKAAGQGVQPYAAEKAGAGGALGKQANFARMAGRHFQPLPASQKANPKKRGIGQRLAALD